MLDGDMMDEPGSYFIKFKEGIPGIVRKDMMVDDLWILLKRPVVTNLLAVRIQAQYRLYEF